MVKNINENNNKLLEMDPFNDWVIQPSDWRINSIDAINLILDFNEAQLDLVYKYHFQLVIIIKEKHSKIINHFM